MPIVNCVLPAVQAPQRAGVVNAINGRSVKNELAYTPDTWVEWNGKSTATIVNNYLRAINLEIAITLPTNFKPSTKYGLLMNIRKNARTSSFACPSFSTGYPFTNSSVVAGFTGNRKVVITSQATITNNFFKVLISPSDPGELEFGDIRVFELPPGSEIEADFNNLTADELAAKYPY